MIFLDFEVFAHDWLVVFADTEKEEFRTICNDADELRRYYQEHKKDIFIGYNIRKYDQWIFKAILAGLNPKAMNDHIILFGGEGYTFSSLLKAFPIIFFDVMPNIPVSLKTLEGFMGNNIKETEVNFDLGRKLTDEELKLTEQYCRADVEALMDVFVLRKKEFESHLSLITAFDLPIQYLSKTQAQISAEILGCERVDFHDEWHIELVDTLRIKKYAHVIDWFNQQGSYVAKLETMVAGVKHIFAFGGLHGAREQYHGTGQILHVDVNSYYPSIMIEYGLLSRSVKNPEKYREIRDKRLQYKKEKNPLQAPYKIVLNGTYGICKDKHSKAYDPRRANEVCINGQLLLLDLIEHLEAIEGFELIQSNTDGLIIKIPDTDEAFDQVDDICYEWESRTRMGLGFDYIQEIWQKDVNNYVFVDVDGEVERKGAYVKGNTALDNDLPILNTALVDYFTKGIPVEKTIMDCKDLQQFQKIYKLTSKYLYAKHNNRKLQGKVFRVFASNDGMSTPLYKVKQKYRRDGNDYLSDEKFINCPKRCFIRNGDIKGVSTDDVPELDKEWYIEQAKKRLKDYGLFQDSSEIVRSLW